MDLLDKNCKLKVFYDQFESPRTIYKKWVKIQGPNQCITQSLTLLLLSILCFFFFGQGKNKKLPLDSGDI